MKEKIMDAFGRYLDAFRKYTVFNGRATRRDYWSFILVNMVVALLIGLVEEIIGMDDDFLSSIYSLAIVCPNITLTTRRLHDVNRSGWWQLAIIVPLLNFYLAYLVWIKPGTTGDNKFGAAVAAAETVYGAYSVPVANEFSGYEMCPSPKPAAQPELNVQPEAEPAPVPELVAEIPHCASCGAALEPNAKFCSECGSPVNK